MYSPSPFHFYSVDVVLISCPPSLSHTHTVITDILRTIYMHTSIQDFICSFACFASTFGFDMGAGTSSG